MVLPKWMAPAGTYIGAIATVQTPKNESLASQEGILKSSYLIHCLDWKLSQSKTFYLALLLT